MGWRKNESRRGLKTAAAGTILFLQRGFDRDAWEEGRRGLDYAEQPPPPDPSTTVPPSAGFGDLSLLSKPLMIMLFVAIALVIVWFVISSVKTRRRSAEKKSATSGGKRVNSDALDERTPWDILLREYERARAEGRYRDALRLLYGLTLNKLDHIGVLVADPDKTNREYLRELRGNALENDFARLTRLHEVGWYGDLSLHRNQFEAIEPMFMQFIDKIDEG